MAQQQTSVYGFNTGNNLSFYPLHLIPENPGTNQAQADYSPLSGSFAPHKGDYANAKLAAHTADAWGSDAYQSSNGPHATAFNTSLMATARVNCSNAREAAQRGAAQCIDLATGHCLPRTDLGNCPASHVPITLGVGRGLPSGWQP